jgi:4-amino-4-deoxy-L-arabinose transferase-like glycosyltransferase
MEQLETSPPPLSPGGTLTAPPAGTIGSDTRDVGSVPETSVSGPDPLPHSVSPACRGLAVWAWTLGLATVGLALRTAFESQRLYHWDSVQFALALQHFDVRLHQPHPPGYFYYVAAAGWASAWTGTPARGMALLSTLFGALAAGVLYRLGREMAGERAGRAAGLLALTAPLSLFYSAIALTYSVDLFWVSLTALFCYRLFRGADGWANVLGAAAAWGIAGGVRPTTLLFLAPIAALAAWGARRHPGRLAAGAIVTAALTIGWLAPTVALSGDWAGYLGALRDEQHVLRDTAVWRAGSEALLAALRQHLRCLAGILGVAFVPLLVDLASSLKGVNVTLPRRHGDTEKDTEKSSEKEPVSVHTFLRVPFSVSPCLRGEKDASSLLSRFRTFALSRSQSNVEPLQFAEDQRGVTVFLLVWGLPSALFYAAVHFVSPGYAMTYAGALLVLAGASVARVCGRIARREARAGLLGALVAANLGLFAFGDRLAGGDLGHGVLYLAEIRSHDEYWQRFPDVARRVAPPGRVLILTAPTFTEGLRVAQYFLPEYRADIRQPLLTDPRSPLPYPVRQGELPVISPASVLADTRPKLCVARTAVDRAFFQQLFGPAVQFTQEDGITVGRILPRGHS